VVAGERLHTDKDMGHDGYNGDRVAGDAFGFSLSYFSNTTGQPYDDYKARKADESINLGLTHNSTIYNYNRNLFNGNIKTMVTALRDTKSKPIDIALNNYTYDQLNRIRNMESHILEPSTLAPQYNDLIQTSYNYDRNGNLKKLNRNAIIGGTVQHMDALTYHYNMTGSPSRLENNQLLWVDDAVPATVTNVDVDDQDKGNYTYDAIGQLTKDEAEGLKSIEWTVTGKVKKIIKVKNEVTEEISFTYDPLGNRLSKSVKNKKGTTTTYYIRDAQGNPLAVYQCTKENNEIASFYLQENDIYGSKRLGIHHYDSKTGNMLVSRPATDVYANTIGDKQYELSNHLGNVLSVITDQKLLNIQRGTPVFEARFDEDDEIMPFSPTPDITKVANTGHVLLVENTPGIPEQGAYTTISLQSGKKYLLNFDMPLNELEGTFEVIILDNTSNDAVIKELIEQKQTGHLSYTFTAPTTGGYTLSFLTYEKAQGTFSLDNIEILDITGLNPAEVAAHSQEMPIFVPSVLSFSDYYPFGMLMPGRHASSSFYRYGFGGQEKDDEIKGKGNHIAYAERGYDPRVARWISVDVYAPALASFSPYNYALNNPICLVDEEGNWPKPSSLLPDDTSPLIKGLVDGVWEGLTGSVGFAWDYATDSKFREQVNASFKALINDPLGTLQGIVDEYADLINRTLSGDASDEDIYRIGEEIGENGIGLLLGGSTLVAKGVKKFSKLKIAKGRFVKKIIKETEKMPAWVKAGKDFEIDLMNKFVNKGYKVVTQVSFAAIDPKTGKKIRAVVDGIVIKNGKILGFVEAKLTKGKTQLTRNQKIVYEALRKGEAVAVGSKAKKVEEITKGAIKVGEKVKANVHILYKQ